jgi:hypothetical protein
VRLETPVAGGIGAPRTIPSHLIDC